MRPSTFFATIVLILTFATGLYAFLHAPYWGLGACLVGALGFFMAIARSEQWYTSVVVEKVCFVLVLVCAVICATIFGLKVWVFAREIQNTALYVLMIGFAGGMTMVAIVICMYSMICMSNAILEVMHALGWRQDEW